MIILEKIRDCSKLGFHAWYRTDSDFVVRKPIIAKFEKDYVPEKKVDHGLVLPGIPVEVKKDPIVQEIQLNIFQRFWRFLLNKIINK